MSERRKQRKARRTEAVNSERQRRVRGILTTLGLWKRLERTSQGDRLLNSHYPLVKIQQAPGLAFVGGNDATPERIDQSGKEGDVQVPATWGYISRSRLFLLREAHHGRTECRRERPARLASVP